MVDSPTASGMADELERLRNRVTALEHGMAAVALRIDSEVHEVSEGFKDQRTFIVKHFEGFEQRLEQKIEARFAQVEERFVRIEHRMDLRFTLLDDKLDRFIAAQTKFNRLVEARLRRLERPSGTAPASSP